MSKNDKISKEEAANYTKSYAAVFDPDRTAKINAANAAKMTAPNGYTVTTNAAGTPVVKRTNSVSTAPAPTNSKNYSSNNYSSDNYSLYMDNSYEQYKQSLISQLKQRISEQKQALQPLRNNIEVSRNKNAVSLREALANQGDNGGNGRQAMLENNTAADNQINAIDLQANNLDAQGNADIANISSTYDLEALKSAIQQSQFNDSLAQQAFQNKLAEASLTGYYKGLPTVANLQQQFNNNFATQQFEYQKTLDTLNRQDALTDKEWERSANNPAYKAQLLDNEINQLKLANLPAQYKQEADQIKQQLAEGQINIDTAKEQLRRLKQTPIKSSTSTPSVSQQNLDAKQNAQQIAGQVQTYLDQWASGKASDKSGRADQTDMINYLKANSGALTSQGVDVNSLIQWVNNNYSWVRPVK